MKYKIDVRNDYFNVTYVVYRRNMYFFWDCVATFYSEEKAIDEVKEMILFDLQFEKTEQLRKEEVRRIRRDNKFPKYFK